MNATWINWAGTAKANPSIATPSNADAIAEAVRRAADSGSTIKVQGAGHSFTGIAATDDILLDLSQLRGEIVVDRALKQITVGAGMSLRVLNALLARNGLALPNLGDIDVQTCAGATSTGTHGTGAKLGGLATFIAAVTLIDGSGNTHHITSDDPRLEAAALGLGALGVITDITWQCVDAFTLVADERPLHVEKILNDFDELADNNDHFEFFWFPRASQALVKRNNRTGDAPVLSPLRSWFDDQFLSNTVFGAMCGLSRAFPVLVPAVTAVSARALSARRYSDQSHRVFCTPRDVRFVEMEYAVPRRAFREVFEKLQHEASKRRVVFPVEVRVAASDSLWLSTAHGRDTVYFAVHQFKDMPYREYFDAVETIMREHQGRPHWGKMHTVDASDFTTLYPKFDAFCSLRDELDPHRVFTNPYLDVVLGQ